MVLFLTTYIKITLPYKILVNKLIKFYIGKYLAINLNTEMKGEQHCFVQTESNVFVNAPEIKLVKSGVKIPF